MTMRYISTSINREWLYGIKYTHIWIENRLLSTTYALHKLITLIDILINKNVRLLKDIEVE